MICLDKVIVIVGPTGVGKTKLSIELAKKLDGEIINADSTQIYKDNDIATAKIKEDEMENIKHHLLSIKELNEDYTVFDYQKDARKCIDDIINRGKLPILVGGTGLYIKACLYNYDFEEVSITRKDYSKYSNEELYKLLLEFDSNTNIHPNNRKRVENSLDYFYSTNKIKGNVKSDKLMYDATLIGLTTDRNELYDKINNRVDVMIENGLIDEAKKIYDSNVRTKAVLTPIGYKELFPYFEGNKSLEGCILDIKQGSRRYAKRQYTWFNNQMNVNWFNVDYDDFNKTIEEVTKFIRGESNV